MAQKDTAAFKIAAEGDHREAELHRDVDAAMWHLTVVEKGVEALSMQPSAHANKEPSKFNKTMAGVMAGLGWATSAIPLLGKNKEAGVVLAILGATLGGISGAKS
jgi:hypothetical protein